MAHKLSRSDRAFVENELVDDALDSRFEAVAKRPDIAAIKWSHNGSHLNSRLYTAYGTLEVGRTHSGSTIWRDERPLIQPRSSKPAIFSTVRAAKAAGLVHLQDSFGDFVPLRDGLRWDLPLRRHFRAEVRPPLTLQPESLPDDHEWGRDKLKRLLEKFEGAVSATDRALENHLDAVVNSWALSLPSWTICDPGHFELKTPHGKLVIRRMVGWVVERNGAPRVWFSPGRLIIFDKLEHAKICGLLHARDYGEHNPYPDGTRWAECIGVVI